MTGPLACEEIVFSSATDLLRNESWRKLKTEIFLQKVLPVNEEKFLNRKGSVSDNGPIYNAKRKLSPIKANDMKLAVGCTLWPKAVSSHHQKAIRS